MGKPLCIYHGNCADGFAAAWVVRKFFGDGNVDFHPGVYGQAPPDVANREVYLVDFSYKRAILDAMVPVADLIIILDHHKTAAADLAHIERIDYHGQKHANKLAGVFDMERSGAMIAWNYFFPGEEPPQLLKHIQDRDLWLFKLEGTREIQANVFSYPYDFAVWDELMAAPIHSHLTDGRAIERKHHKDVAELVAVTKRTMRLGGYSVPMANLPYTLTSDAGHLMAKSTTAGIAGCYWDTPGGRVFSLRSTDNGPDVSAIAAAYGGGGHAHASGFTMPLGWEGDAA